ncbi:hypothetical protein B0H10DRAFT_1943841 [Mycena sp. CBHHK59/15]|nr:hypothetical protein B0H10DRAFT_1943841 [Mycena sp. CBHHK59/15]
MDYQYLLPIAQNLLIVAVSDFLVIPLAVEWMALVAVILLQLCRMSRDPKTQPSVVGDVVAFGGLFALSLTNMVVFLIRVSSNGEAGNAFCNDFLGRVNPCGIAASVIALSSAATAGAFFGIVVSLAGPISYLFRTIFRFWRRPADENAHAIELVHMKNPPSSYCKDGKEVWTIIPF